MPSQGRSWCLCGPLLRVATSDFSPWPRPTGPTHVTWL